MQGNLNQSRGFKSSDHVPILRPKVANKTYYFQVSFEMKSCLLLIEGNFVSSRHKTPQIYWLETSRKDFAAVKHMRMNMGFCYTSKASLLTKAFFQGWMRCTTVDHKTPKSG